DQDLADRVAWYAMGAGPAAHRSRTSKGQSADARNNRGGPALLVDVANLIFGRDLAGADHLDAVPGNPVGRFAAEPFDTQPLVQAGSPVDRAGRAQVGELVGSPGLGGNLVFIEPVEQFAHRRLVQRLGPDARGASQPLHHVGRVHSGGL